MFAIEPYAAERQVFKSNDKGGMDSVWEPVRVLGVTMQDDEPVYIVETLNGRDRMLECELYVRRT
ncbi:hypothetical protein EOA33_12030 [Mesorhizobium sp. M4A.F.Ca.ET.050.02.1.1]|uniref:hypothetical protein n=1 Tax=Mesorhizobium sp. M4A.F.Ca.ET.050.02.1.1 TaxID=2496754 RepID=UPI000FCCD124|nr:hypothetical protein [Mesorhizobium sp. M4A.F.Ca.ET.050.02.1.1]RUX49613.1 hypothetical protein EOA33_12030 [Mesorhizobium sp. M4A.F.Ca.ET.050.02.1.1]